MALPSSQRLTPHFTAGELGADNPAITGAQLSNLYRVAQWLEIMRTLCGDRPIIVTSGFRTVQHNRDVGGSGTSSHLDGLAADVKVQGVSLFSVYRTLSDARAQGTLPVFDQVIFYPIQGHCHVGLGGRSRKEFRIRIYEGTGGTPLLTADLIATLPGFGDEDTAPNVLADLVPWWVPLIAGAALILLLVLLP